MYVFHILVFGRPWKLWVPFHGPVSWISVSFFSFQYFLFSLIWINFDILDAIRALSVDSFGLASYSVVTLVAPYLDRITSHRINPVHFWTLTFSNRNKYPSNSAQNIKIRLYFDGYEGISEIPSAQYLPWTHREPLVLYTSLFIDAASDGCVYSLTLRIIHIKYQ